MDNQKLLQHVAVLAGQQALLDGHVALLLVRRRRRRRNRRQSRSCWVRTLLSEKRRLQFGHYDRLMAEIRMEDQKSVVPQKRSLLHVSLYSWLSTLASKVLGGSMVSSGGFVVQKRHHPR
ncbi:hypothetical protein DPMN_176227 [Dreissena polymorpha]|uniref:Uncharacterized protein n=1 Tax=Dreissena polymorpha TaxID=45954 RepID=A0A9D4E6I9_DREPO|nr:hypothetical protein DPMN_176227 [Dreissena polymorpha]